MKMNENVFVLGRFFLEERFLKNDLMLLKTRVHCSLPLKKPPCIVPSYLRLLLFIIPKV